ncbi:MAG: response regulator, partial [Cyanobacteria bacterium P01_D01_bin.2]
GYKVFAANRGDEGLILAVTESPDLILIDIDIPVVNGWQVIKILKSSKATWLTPVIALAERNVDSRLLLQTGFDAYYRKPVSLRHLLLKVEALVGAASDGPVSVAESPPLSRTVAPPPAPPPAQVTPQVAQAMVVYVDDSPADSQAMATIVQKAGYSYANISDSLQALPKLLELKPQIIFLDLVMPMANGYELCAQIRRISAFKETPIIIVTNNDGIADRVRAKVVGASGFFGKPIKEQRVMKVLRRYLRPSRRYRSTNSRRHGFLLNF